MKFRDDENGRTGWGSRTLLAMVAALCLVTLVVAIYAFVERRGDATRTPRGADYMGGGPGG